MRGGQGRAEAWAQGCPPSSLGLSPDLQPKWRREQVDGGRRPCRTHSAGGGAPSPHSRAEPASWPARRPHLGFLEVPLLVSASNCFSSSPRADSTWENRLVTVSRALACRERKGGVLLCIRAAEDKWGCDY